MTPEQSKWWEEMRDRAASEQQAASEVHGWDYNRWPNFHPQEFTCRRTGLIYVNLDALDKLQELRDEVEHPLVVTSGYRTPAHNQAIGGAARSMHLIGIAFDIQSTFPEVLARQARGVGFTGIKAYSGWTHMDLRPWVWSG